MMLLIHSYFNIWCEARAGWNVYMKRRTAVQKISSLPEATSAELENFDDVCAICYQEMHTAKITRCRHYFHGVCLRKWLYVQDKVRIIANRSFFAYLKFYIFITVSIMSWNCHKSRFKDWYWKSARGGCCRASSTSSCKRAMILNFISAQYFIFRILKIYFLDGGHRLELCITSHIEGAVRRRQENPVIAR